ncbi:quinone-dependent dihydroorotate dehydrogenase [Sphingobacterium spiritivorum]|uniref:Dihydroorotate dehydrogenase (quinone) n=1 Tax=Sphingobacterium spiritivorum ATCC 33861 TaxID=525373 RepID=D7VQC7_SPHSI|nr:quinone-dependent dihydroorotate dehydrogenase [Sphingobacterium spiritivorum]EFK55978.1 dihydroorotate oxidase [Sphingobacterium spiritivorum ATCC 33861]QQT35889.1 quinone-dependent dihydroorotate dehydrogenase [Sphingobacterium spiritivorum]WQD32616.1 quinone-dependent dihydroorotate dehydrogenase [Sphingobacterium spiritivorum]SUJ11719.1 Dihydroorotate dehydrogenase (quinone) [Sphingobacterium spiritivorum]
MYKLIKPFFFSMNPESAHHTVTGGLQTFTKIWGAKSLLKSIYTVEDKRLEREVFGLKFKNPVGLAAGFDKNGEYIDEMVNFGFGFIEIGTVTPRPQPGNDKPRMFRLVSDKALINRMGFNNQGADVAAGRLRHLKQRGNIIIGGNIGKNKVTPNEDAVLDYIYCFKALFDYVDYFVVNVSSPNTPGLRDLQEKEPLMNILRQLMDINNKDGVSKPILLKIAPDLTDSQLDDIVEIVQETKIAGVIATNTTVSRDGLQSDPNLVKETGGVSGKPLTNRSTVVIRYLADKSSRSFPIIGVGGIHSAQDAIEKLDAGASLIQVYTGFIYEGPGLISDICKGILKAGK